MATSGWTSSAPAPEARSGGTKTSARGRGRVASVGRVGGDGGAGKAGRPGGAGKESPARAYAEFLKPYDPAVRKLADGLRALVRSEVAPCHETIYDAGYTIALHYAATPRTTETFCSI